MVHALLRPRHLAATALVFLLAGGALGGVAGLITARAASDDAVPTFVFAAPQGGDRAFYEVQDADGLAFLTREPPANVTIVWEPDSVLMTDDGLAALHNNIRFRMEFAPDTGMDPEDWTYHFAPGADASTMQTRHTWETPVEEGRVDEVQRAHRYFMAREVALPCAIRSSVQGETLAVGESLGESFSCFADGPTAFPAERTTARFVRLGTDEDPGRAVVEVSDGRRDEILRLLYAPNVPYPVSIEVVKSDVVQTWTMTAFQRGTLAVAAQADGPAGKERPVLRFAPLSTSGIDVTGVEHTFPPNEAYQRALEDPQFPDLRAFLADRPESYIAEAIYRTHRNDGPDGDWDSWHFLVTDGAQAMDFNVRRIERYMHQANEILDSLGLRPTSYDYSAWDPVDDEGEHPTLAQRPKTAPTWASLLEQWMHFRTEEYADAEPNYLRFAIFCGTDCTEIDQRYEAGHTWSHREYSEPIGGETTTAEKWTAVEFWDITGRDDYSMDRPNGYFEYAQAWYLAGEPSPLPPPSDGEPNSSSTATVVPVWLLPTGKQAAWAGGGALLAAALYYLLPLIKTGTMGLFSRIQGPAVLDNPHRRRIQSIVAADPGIHHQEMTRRLGIGNGAAEHHLRKMITEGIVVSHKAAGKTCYFLPAASRSSVAAAAVLKSPVARRIHEETLAHPGLQVADLRRKLGIAASTMHYHLQRLGAAGVIIVEKAGNGQSVRPAASSHR